MDVTADQRPRGLGPVRRGVLSAGLAVVAGLSVLAQQSTPSPRAFQTTARFSVDADVLHLQTAVALAGPHARYKQFSWVRLYFYAFPLTREDVAALSTGSIAGLERKRTQVAPGGP